MPGKKTPRPVAPRFQSGTAISMWSSDACAGNAIKFTDAGGSVTLRGSAGKREVEISVDDTGPGIPRDDLDRIFDAYHSIQRSGQRGTGLWVVYRQRHRASPWRAAGPAQYAG
jgi:nitrogen-specific signal transduction histidine kinase